MYQPTPRLKELLEPKQCSVPASEQKQSLRTHQDTMKSVSKPRTPTGKASEHSESRAQPFDRADYSLGKRYLEEAGRSASRELQSSGKKSRLERLSDLEERYKMMSAKLSGKDSIVLHSNSGSIHRPLVPHSPDHPFLASQREQLERSYGFLPQKLFAEVEEIKEKEAEAPSIRIQSEHLGLVASETACLPEELPLGPYDIDPATKLSFRGYAARTSNGLLRDYNEDRVSIIQKIYVDSVQEYPTSFFALFDGHSGANCADYLRDSLHQHITRQPAFVKDKLKALTDGILECEYKFLEMSKEKQDISGSCAVVCLFEKTKVYTANVGDSRMVMSSNRGKVVRQVTEDHKPDADIEKERIYKHGGAIFRSKRQMCREVYRSEGKIAEIVEDTKYGPFRVDPGGLSVSRTIGDWPAKDASRNGNPNCVVPHPDVFELELNTRSDFMVIACDGIFDVVSNEEVVAGVWETLCKWTKVKGLKEACRLASEFVMKMSFDKKSMDNVTVIVIAFQSEQYYY